ncbi:DUF7344 domain-containing protein (plasmid) [Halococcus morrhuae DSM 1307]|uniref:DUF7344 domain-containing protein n=1 Tax=Halococcus morrhuae TaxID=2250 RepID=UPI0019552951|nr:hypothetical protein [Halococcus morrhuae]
MSNKTDEESFLSLLYHGLRARRRREVIHLIHATDILPLSVRSLAREITATEHGLSRAQATGEPYRNVYNALCQSHLPTLADASIVIYDSKRQTVDEGPNLLLAVFLVKISRPAVEMLQGGESADSDNPW